MTLFLRCAGTSRYRLLFQTPINLASFIRPSGTDDFPVSVISSTKASGDCVSKFTSLVRARDKFPQVTEPGEVLSFCKLFRFSFSNTYILKTGSQRFVPNTCKKKTLEVLSLVYMRFCETYMSRNAKPDLWIPN